MFLKLVMGYRTGGCEISKMSNEKTESKGSEKQQTTPHHGRSDVMSYL